MDLFIKLLNNENNINIVDIRNDYLYLNSHIKNSVNIGEYLLISNPSNYLLKDKIYYIYCSYGRRSFMVTKVLNSLGYNTVNIEGGYKEYLLKNKY